MYQGELLKSWQDLRKGCSDPHLRHSWSGGGWGRRWGRLVAAAWQAKLSKGLDHLPLAAAVEVAVGQSEEDPGGIEEGRGRGNPDLLHHHRGGYQDLDLPAGGDLHQTEAGGREAAAAVVAAVALPEGAVDAAGQAVAGAAVASSFAEPGAAAASAFPPPPFSFAPLPPPSFSCLPPRLYCPKEEEQAQG